MLLGEAGGGECESFGQGQKRCGKGGPGDQGKAARQRASEDARVGLKQGAG